jgi:hypothetical protein
MNGRRTLLIVGMRAVLDGAVARDRLAGVGYGVVAAPAERFAQVVAATGITPADA